MIQFKEKNCHHWSIRMLTCSDVIMKTLIRCMMDYDGKAFGQRPLTAFVPYIRQPLLKQRNIMIGRKQKRKRRKTTFVKITYLTHCLIRRVHFARSWELIWQMREKKTRLSGIYSEKTFTGESLEVGALTALPYSYCSPSSASETGSSVSVLWVWWGGGCGASLERPAWIAGPNWDPRIRGHKRNKLQLLRQRDTRPATKPSQVNDWDEKRQDRG